MGTKNTGRVQRRGGEATAPERPHAGVSARHPALLLDQGAQSGLEDVGKFPGIMWKRGNLKSGSQRGEASVLQQASADKSRKPSPHEVSGPDQALLPSPSL